jgi:hypothetical protein
MDSNVTVLLLKQIFKNHGKQMHAWCNWVLLTYLSTLYEMVKNDQRTEARINK